MDKVSYALGLSIGNNFENSGIKDLQVEDFVKGLTDVLSGNQPAITYDEAKEVINDYFMKLQKERTDAGWLKMAFVHPVEPGLWREWRR